MPSTQSDGMTQELSTEALWMHRPELESKVSSATDFGCMTLRVVVLL